MRLLVAAHAAELVAFEDEVPGFDRLLTGVGKIPATYALTRALAARAYEEIVVVGTAGAIDPQLQSGIHEIDATLQHDARDLEGVRGRHIWLPERVDIASGGVTIATGDQFVDDAVAAAEIRGLGARLVDMESYAYAWVAQQFGVPIRIFKAISDRAQDGAAEEWDDAAVVCSGWLRTHLRELYGV